MEKQEMTQEQFEAEIYKANMVIQKLQAELGASRGQVAQLEVERDSAYNYIKSMKEEEEEEDNK